MFSVLTFFSELTGHCLVPGRRSSMLTKMSITEALMQRSACRRRKIGRIKSIRVSTWRAGSRGSACFDERNSVLLISQARRWRWPIRVGVDRSSCRVSRHEEQALVPESVHAASCAAADILPLKTTPKPRIVKGLSSARIPGGR